LLILNKNKKNLNNKVSYTLLYKEQFKYLKTHILTILLFA